MANQTTPPRDPSVHTTSTSTATGTTTADRAHPVGDASSAKHASGFSAGLGAWLVIAPFLLGYITPASFWNDIVCGLIVLALGVLRYGKPLENVWASWTNAGIGAWLVIAPFVLLPFDAGALWNDVVVGILLILSSTASAMAVSRSPRTAR